MTTFIKSWPLWSMLALLLVGCSHDVPVVHHYTSLANGSNKYVFVYDRHLLVPHHALLLDAGGHTLQPLSDSLEALPVAVQAATFYKDSALLVTLDDGSLIHYVLPSGPLLHIKDTGTAIRGDAFFLNPSTAIRLRNESFDGLNYTGNAILATDLHTGVTCTLVTNAARIFQRQDSLFFTRDFSQLYLLDVNGAPRKLLQLPDSVSQLTGNGAYAAFLSWEGLSTRIHNTYQQDSGAIEADRITHAGSACDNRYVQKYALKVVDNKTGKTLLCDSFPEASFSVQRFRFTDAAHLLVEARQRDSPFVKRAVMISLPDLQRHVFPDNATVLDVTADYVVLLHGELAVYDLHTGQLQNAGAYSDSTAVLANGGCCGVYYFSIAAPGGSASVQALEVKEKTVREVRRLRW